MRLASAGAVLDLTRARHQSLRRLAGAKGSTVRLGSGTLTVTTSGAARYGGSITGTAGAATTTGPGALTLTGSVRTPSGAWQLRQGTLVLGPNARMNVGSLTVSRCGKLTVDLGAAAKGGPVITSGGTVRLSGTLAVSLAPGRSYPAEIRLIHDLINYAADGGHDVVLTAASQRVSVVGLANSRGTPGPASGALASARWPGGLPAVAEVALGLMLTAGVVLLRLRRADRRSGP